MIQISITRLLLLPNNSHKNLKTTTTTFEKVQRLHYITMKSSMIRITEPITTTIIVAANKKHILKTKEKSLFASMKRSLQVALLVIIILPTVVVAGIHSIDSNNNKSNTKRKAISEQFIDFLSVPINFSYDEEESKCNEVLDALTPEELYHAARTSYAYWYLEEEEQKNRKQTETTSARTLSHLQRQSALREARRHLIATDGDVRKATERLQSACQYRKEHQLDLLRLALNDDPSNNQMSETTKRMQQYIESDMAKQPVIMKGTDNQSRSVLFKFPRRSGGTTEEEYITTQLYIAERANAVIEYVSKGRQESMVAIFDFSDSRSSYSPNLQWQISAVRAIQHLYPERLHKLIILEPPFWMRGLYVSIKPFLSKKTSNKIEIVSDRSKLCKDVLNCDVSTVNTFDEKVDLDLYLHKIPFYCPYDCDELITTDLETTSTL